MINVELGSADPRFDGHF